MNDVDIRPFSVLYWPEMSATHSCFLNVKLQAWLQVITVLTHITGRDQIKGRCCKSEKIVIIRFILQIILTTNLPYINAIS